MKNLTNTLTFAYYRYNAMQLFAIALFTAALILFAVILFKIGIHAIKENIRARAYRRDFAVPMNTFKKDPDLEDLKEATNSYALILVFITIGLVVANNL